MSKPLCYAPFIGLYATHNGKYAPCCSSAQFDFNSPEEYLKSDILKDIKDKLLKNQWPESCSRCKYHYSDIPTWDYFKSVVKLDQISVLDYRPSNVCNLKCKMCFASSSNLIEEHVKQNPKLQQWIELPTNGKDQSANIDFIKQNKFKIVKLLGGEPTADKNVWSLLQIILDSYDDLPILKFTTNGTNLNNKFVKLIKQFNHVEITFSIDAVGSTYENIRVNAKWKNTKSNVEDAFKNNIAKKYNFNTVLTPYNIRDLIPLLEWYYSLYSNGLQFKIHFEDSAAYYTSLRAVTPGIINKASKDIAIWSKDKDVNFINKILELTNVIDSVRYDQKSYDSFISYNNEFNKVI